MNKTKGFLRIGIVLSVLWVIFQFVKYELWQSFEFSHYLDDFILEAIIPLVIFWGLVWIAAGFRNIASNFSNEDEDNNDQDK